VSAGREPEGIGARCSRAGVARALARKDPAGPVPARRVPVATDQKRNTGGGVLTGFCMVLSV